MKAQAGAKADDKHHEDEGSEVGQDGQDDKRGKPAHDMHFLASDTCAVGVPLRQNCMRITGSYVVMAEGLDAGSDA